MSTKNTDSNTSPDTDAIDCPLCEDGIQQTTTVVNDGIPAVRAETRTVERECELCNGTGTIAAGQL